MASSITPRRVDGANWRDRPTPSAAQARRYTTSIPAAGIDKAWGNPCLAVF
ncbi:MAG: hypothetical protein IGR92_10415 [Leptolyngbyaceae cyanobacterium T60_A2020_046]|nr:hypothetical protein [Leptolyngbyaceae cyanobacterium T60_A2020_046]